MSIAFELKSSANEMEFLCAGFGVIAEHHQIERRKEREREREETPVAVDQVVKINDSNYLRRLMLNSMRRTVWLSVRCLLTFLCVRFSFSFKNTNANKVK